MQIPAQLVYISDSDTIEVRIPAADGEGDVAVLSLPGNMLDEAARHLLRHVRTEEQTQVTGSIVEQFHVHRSEYVATTSALVDEDANHWDAIDALAAEITP